MPENNQLLELQSTCDKLSTSYGFIERDIGKMKDGICESNEKLNKILLGMKDIENSVSINKKRIDVIELNQKDLKADRKTIAMFISMFVISIASMIATYIKVLR